MEKVNWGNFKSKFKSRNSFIQKVKTDISVKQLEIDKQRFSEKYLIDYPDLRSPRLSSFRSSEGVASSQHSVVPPSRNSKMDVYKSVDALNLKMLKELDREPDGVYSNKLDYKIVSQSWKDKLLLKQAEF
jgi:hypothetical protein